MKKSIIHGIMMIVLSVLISCGSDSTGPEPPPADWLPLSVGNWWSGEIDGFMLLGIQADTFDLSGSMDRTVTALVEHQEGFQLYRMETVMEMEVTHPDTSFTVTDTMEVYLRNTGEEMRGYSDTITTDYEVLARFPFTVGDSWQAWEDSTVTYQVASLTSSVSVPAGSFADCALLRETDSSQPDYTWDHYFHRGTGFVRDSVTILGQQLLTIDLVSWGIQD